MAPVLPDPAPPARPAPRAVNDETLFGTLRRTHELWFTQLLRELAGLQRSLAAGDCAGALRDLDRSLRVMKMAAAQMEIFEPLATPRFAALGATARFRETEAVLGQRHPWMHDGHPEESDAGGSILAAMNRPSVFDSFLSLLVLAGYPVPLTSLYRDVTAPLKPSPELQSVLVRVYHDDGAAAQICERLTDLDECFQAWRYRHLSMLERTTSEPTTSEPTTSGAPGTDEVPGALASRAQAFAPLFPDLWAVRRLL
ncbi:tryptophan 2,3-dioxygenase [Sphaerimonospora cavernae]|uniref:Tryptophan 2,3-dioxygenase n=1 Tax=Sphaerimonospora cavernae TaxID=1740611 RepID=A0ABV6U7A1_9ACTN